MSVH
jgi:hypothetical protein